MLKGNSFRPPHVERKFFPICEVIDVFIVAGTSYQSAVSNVTTEGKEPFSYPYGILIFQVSLYTLNHRNVELWLQVENKHLCTQLQEIHPAGVKMLK